MAGLNVCYFVALTVPVGHPLVPGLSLVTQWVPVGILVLVAVSTRAGQAAVVLATLAVTATALGDTYYSLAMDDTGYLPSPSPADAGYILFYPLMVAALVALVRRRLASAAGIVLVESAVAALGVASLLALILDPLIRDAMAGRGAFDAAIAVAYPLFDLILLAIVAGIAPSLAVGPRWWSLVTGIGAFAAGDILNAALMASGSYRAGTALDALWPIGLAFITWWAVGTAQPHSPADSPSGRFVVPIPALAVVTGIVVLIIGTQTRLSILTIVLAATTLTVASVPIVFRQLVLRRLLSDQNEVVRQLQDLDRHKSELMVTMNHEFRTPVTTINGYVELLLDGDGGPVSPEGVEMLRAIEHNGARLHDLVDELLLMSRLEAGDTEPVTRPVYVAGLLSRAVDPVSRSAKSKGVTISLDVPNFSLTVDADGSQLERALTNVIENAVKFTPSGGTVRVSGHGPVDGLVLIRVVDTGMGIPAAELPQLFTRFFRASNARKASVPGAGLGLAITKSVVTAHHGRVTLTSTLGEGTTVTIVLPVCEQLILPPRSPAAPSE